MQSVLLDAAGHRRLPATLPGYHRGRPPRNKGEQYPADPPSVEEIVAVIRSIGDGADGYRLRALIVLLWRAGLRISEALALSEGDLDRSRGAVPVRRGTIPTRLKRRSHSVAFCPQREAAGSFAEVRRVVDELAPRPAPVDFCSLCRTSSNAGADQDYWPGTVPSGLDAMGWDDARVRDGPAVGAVCRLRRVRVCDGGASRE